MAVHFFQVSQASLADPLLQIVVVVVLRLLYVVMFDYDQISRPDQRLELVQNRTDRVLVSLMVPKFGLRR